MHLILLLSTFFTFVQFNCENLFDCEHDSLKNDYEFLPTSDRHWDKNKYWQKVNGVARTILSCGDSDSTQWALPDIVALCEVENDSVLRDLTKRSLLRNSGYEYVMTNSDDERGIDVALLYSPFSFRLLEQHAIKVQPEGRQHHTRDILYVKGLRTGGDTLHVVVVHAPSRASGTSATRDYRLKVAKMVVNTVDSIMNISPDAAIIVAGDFNDYQGDESIKYLSENRLTDVSYGAKGNNGAKGTYKFKGNWGSLDHIFINDVLRKLSINCRINDAAFLLDEDSKYGGVQPKRTYVGHRYHGGISDHLPLVVTIK